MKETKRLLSPEAQKVIDFINDRPSFFKSGKEGNFLYSFERLTWFLRKNNYSCIPAYYCYLAGKMNFLDFKLPIEVHHWHAFKMKRIKDIDAKKKYKIQLIDELNSDQPRQSVIKQNKASLFLLRNASFDNFKQQAWKYIKDEEETQSYIDSMNSEQERLYNIEEGNDSDNDFCEACQNSPCICSDRERTSTTFNS